ANPIWVQLLSHKLARLVVPWALPVVLVSSFLIDGWLGTAAVVVQAILYGLGVLGLLTHRGGRLTEAPASFLALNAAAWVAFWVWLSGRAERSWVKVNYVDRREEIGAIGEGEPGTLATGGRAETPVAYAPGSPQT